MDKVYPKYGRVSGLAGRVRNLWSVDIPVTRFSSVDFGCLTFLHMVIACMQIVAHLRVIFNDPRAS